MTKRTRTQPTRRGASRSKRLRAATDWLKSIITGFLLFAVIRVVLIQTFTIISGSMEGTLLVGDFLVVSKSAYGATIPATGRRLPGYDKPTRGDVVVFRSPIEALDLVKRLVALPGDTIAMRNGILQINSVPQVEPYVQRRHVDPDVTDAEMLWQSAFLLDPSMAHRYQPTRDNWGPIVVPHGSYFMLGDNRDESRDSRYWGFVPFANLKGRAVLLYFSWAREEDGSLLPIPRVRWSRIGDRIQ